MPSTNDVGLESDRVRNQSRTVSEDLCCSICHNILWKPVACQKCETHFCSACIEKWLCNGRNQCPLGCGPYRERPCSKFVNTPLSRLQVACIYESNGCREILPYEAVGKHETQCGYQPQQCPACRSSFPRNKIETHISHCELIEFTCADCKIVYKRRDASQRHTDIICIKEQFRQYRHQSQTEIKQLKEQFQQDICQSQKEIKQLKGDLEELRHIFSTDIVKVTESMTKIIQKQQFAKPGTYNELDCKGRPCITCGDCRDWHFTDDEDTWEWVRNYKNWTDEDRSRWDDDRAWELFERRDGATCIRARRGRNRNRGGLHLLNDTCFCKDNIVP
ncbi:unnamed protein product [Adineta steineri]|uniref:Uncharacterized protein n=1 Tax=Adineta steineri TaxID=433720 RepID=A0A816BQ47_9BILA|nr:unnamed protein product [Adineta steineri]CAF1613048.1 unnamed protein product [Adineta steineri]